MTKCKAEDQRDTLQLLSMMRQAGFKHISIRPNLESGKLLAQMFPTLGVENFVASALIEAVK